MTNPPARIAIIEYLRREHAREMAKFGPDPYAGCASTREIADATGFKMAHTRDTLNKLYDTDQVIKYSDGDWQIVDRLAADPGLAPPVVPVDTTEAGHMRAAGHAHTDTRRTRPVDIIANASETAHGRDKAHVMPDDRAVILLGDKIADAVELAGVEIRKIDNRRANLGMNAIRALAWAMIKAQREQ